MLTRCYLNNFYFRNFLLIIFLAATIFFNLTGCKKRDNSTGKISVANFEFPAEFSKQKAVWLAWPTYTIKRNMPTYPIILKIIGELQAYVQVKIIISKEIEKRKIINLLNHHNIPATNVRFYVVPHDGIWMRDYGPVFLRSATGNSLKVVKFNFSMWGYEQTTSPNSLLCAGVSKAIARLMKVDILSTNIISEDGNRSFNGEGVMITNSAVELQRNPGMTKQQLEQEYKRVFGIKKVIWVEQGAYDDPLTFAGKIIGPDGKKSAYAIGTGGHVDEFVRFVGPHTILLAEVSPDEAKHSPIAKINYVRMQNTLKILQGATDLHGKHFKIVRIPFPANFYATMRPDDGAYEYLENLVYQDGSIFPKGKPIQVMAAASYVNFLISNGVIIAPKYWKPGLANSIKQQDKKAVRVLQSLFPDRKIITIDALPINYGGGGIHCITQQEPELTGNQSKDYR